MEIPNHGQMKAGWLWRPVGAVGEGKGRIEYLDIAKGIGIILVAWYHSDIVPGKFLNLFFMPLFFFISGVFLRPEIAPREFSRKKWRELLLPFLVFFAASLLLEWAVWDMADWKGAEGEEFFSFARVRNVPLWFLLTLSYTSVMAYLVEHFITSRWARYATYAAITIIGWYLSYNVIRLPLYLSQAFLAFPFFIAGYLLREPVKSGRVFTPAAIIAAVAVGAWVMTRDTVTNFHRLTYAPHYLPSFIAGASLLFIVLAMAWGMSHTRRFGWLATIGRWTLLILGIHMFLMRPLVEHVFPRLGMEKHFEGFDSEMALSLVAAIVVVALAAAIGIAAKGLWHRHKKAGS